MERQECMDVTYDLIAKFSCGYKFSDNDNQIEKTKTTTDQQHNTCNTNF